MPPKPPLESTSISLAIVSKYYSTFPKVTNIPILPLSMAVTFIDDRLDDDGAVMYACTVKCVRGKLKAHPSDHFDSRHSA